MSRWFRITCIYLHKDIYSQDTHTKHATKIAFFPTYSEREIWSGGISQTTTLKLQCHCSFVGLYTRRHKTCIYSYCIQCLTLSFCLRLEKKINTYRECVCGQSQRFHTTKHTKTNSFINMQNQIQKICRTMARALCKAWLTSKHLYPSQVPIWIV